MSVRKTTSQPIVREQCQYLLDQAGALISYAASNTAFSCYLYHCTQHLLVDADTLPTLAPPSPFLKPKDGDSARVRTDWLLSELSRREHEDAALVSALLIDWRRRIEPKEQIIGIVGIAIIGPTLGIVKRRKKKRSQMPIIIESDARSLPASKLAELVHDVSTKLTSSALRHVDGDAHRLHPDLFEWYFEDRKLALYVASTKEFRRLQQQLRDERLQYIHTHKNDGGTALAISPEVSNSILDGSLLTTLESTLQV